MSRSLREYPVMSLLNAKSVKAASAVLVLTLACGVLAAPSILARQNTGINKTNWEQDPRILAIREVVSATNAGLKSGELKTSQRKLEYCDDGGLYTLRRIAHDAKGGVPWYANYGEGQDASWDFQYYYDRAGRLRFVYALARSTNGTREQMRVYFDEAGKRVWKADDMLKGPGCPGCFSGYSDTDKKFVYEPAKEFATLGNCQEIKPKN
jgi:hypothetical protein